MLSSFARLPRVVFMCGVVALLGSLAVSADAQVTLDWVTVGDPGNAADTTGYGAVNYEYRIGKFEVTIQQYTDFLNAVAATDDPYALYDNIVTPKSSVGISRTGSIGSYTYSVIGPFGSTPAGASSPGNRPISQITWFEAARFANWMHNGQGSGSTETGAYTLVDGQTSGAVPARNPGATFYIPTENEWYKAAFYSPVKGGPGLPGYFSYTTQSDTLPGNTIGSETNQVNWWNYSGVGASVTQSNSWDPNQNYLTDVGAFANSASYYGTFDQGGNVFEWIDVASGLLRGGDWSNDTFGLSSSSSDRYTIRPQYQSSGNRFSSGKSTSHPRTLHLRHGPRRSGIRRLLDVAAAKAGLTLADQPT